MEVLRVYHCKRHPNNVENLVYVGRPTEYGNPFTVEQYGRGEAVKKFATWIWEKEQRGLRDKIRAELAGKNLACWCAPYEGLLPTATTICHAQIEMQIANNMPDFTMDLPPKKEIAN